MDDDTAQETATAAVPGTGHAVWALRRVAYLLERVLAPTYRVAAYRTAARVLAGLSHDELDERVRTGTLTALKGIGDKTAAVASQAHRGQVPAYLRDLETDTLLPVTGGADLRAALQGDCHTHSDWSDGGSPIEEMARAALELGHSYVVLTDHSPRLKVANGLTAERLLRQLDVVAEINDRLAAEAPGFRILTGIECDILDDGSLDQSPELLSRLDVVVASVHSKLRMDNVAMTRRMVAAVSNPHTDVLGHCTGRNVMPRGRSGKVRPESDFDAAAVFAACEQHGVAVEVNCRPERLDPPRRLLRQAVEAGCLFAIDTDAHAPGQLEWQVYGCERAEECGVAVERVVNARSAQDLLAWAARG